MIGYRLDDPVSAPQILYDNTVSTPTLRHTQYPLRWLKAVVFPEVVGQKVNFITDLHLVPR